jgi:tetratricopeptide (TPR) repeat protein
MEKQNYAEASAQFKRLIAAFPDSRLRERAYYQLGECYFKFGQFDEALKMFRDLYIRSPKSELGSYAKFRMGWCYFSMNKEKEAIQEFEEFLAQYPESPITAEVYEGIGEYYFNRGQYQKSREYLQIIPRRFPSNPLCANAYFGIAMAYEREGDLWASVAQIQKLADQFPKSELAAKGILRVAELLVSQGKSDEAKVELMKIVSQETGGGPFKTLAQKKLAEILKTQGFLREAELYFSEALKRSRGDLACEIEFELAEVFEAKNEMDQAASEFLKLAHLYPNNAIYMDRARVRAAALLEYQKKYNEALKVYEMIADSQSSQADFAKEKIKKIQPILEKKGR